jgi:S4 domain protein YaaA
MKKMKITITTDYITLGQFLKLTRVISNGGDAKIFLLTTAIYVNDELEQRRGRKLRVGDKVRVKDKEFEIIN